LTVGIESKCNIERSEDVEVIGMEVLEGIMRVPDRSLKSVGYVCEATSEPPKTADDPVYGDPYATGFFVSLPCESPQLRDQEMYYFVTAKHVATDLKDRHIFFLVNKKGGGTTHRVFANSESWFIHPTDDNADVAVIQVALSPQLVDIGVIEVEQFARPDRMKKLNIGIGDEVHSIGLFSAVPGEESVTPIVRFGNVSMMGTEKIQTDLGFTEMYLIEARSIGGMSGSPVFVRPTFVFRVPAKDGSTELAFVAGKGDTLLGMAQGHWDIREEEINKSSFTQDRKRGVNYGIALVVPAFKIYETLYQPELKEMRKRLEESIIKQQGTAPGSDSPKDGGNKTFTQADFEDALKRASRKMSGQK